MRRLILSSLMIAGLVACGPSYRDVQQQDTIEGYEAFLEAKPADPNATMARVRLEELYLEQAREGGTLEAYDAYLAKYEEDESAVHMEEAQEEREAFLFKKAESENTAAAWQAYLDQYPQGEKSKKQEARRRLAVAEYIEQIAISAPEVERTNLAENPDGPLDGWGIRADFTNNGDKTIKSLNVEIQYLGADGSVVAKNKWPLCAPAAPGNLPIEEEWKQPVKPGETRGYWYMDVAPDAPDWAKKVRLVPVSISFVEDDKKE